MKPYPQKNPSLEKCIFNYQFSRMRCISVNASSLIAGECLESGFSQNWKKSSQLHLLSLHFTIGLERSLILVKTDFHQQQSIVKIQKLVKLLKAPREKKSPQNHGSHYLTQELNQNPANKAKRISGEFTDYFTNECCIPWQWKCTGADI